MNQRGGKSDVPAQGSQAGGSEETLNEVVSSNEEQQDVEVCFPVWEV